jgi:multidrug efflux pump subunit AcrB
MWQTSGTARKSRNYLFFGLGPAASSKGISPAEATGSVAQSVRDSASSLLNDRYYPAVTVSVAKRKGANATWVAEDLLQRVEFLKGKIIPADIQVTVTRNYGETAREKNNELLFHMFLAAISVTILIALFMGWRAGVVAAVAIPVTLALTLFVFSMAGYTLNRITLFALIFSIGILVDDAIVVIENIHRYFTTTALKPMEAAVRAVDEIGNPTMLATVAVIASVLPMAFVSGLMGPYMRPIPVGSSMAMFFSLLVAFTVTPYFAIRLMRRGHHADSSADAGETRLTRLYRSVMGALLHRKKVRYGFLLSVAALLLVSCSLVYFKIVTVKMLPFDNKSELQVIVDAPNGTALEETARLTAELGEAIRTVPEVTDFQTYIGISAPFNFNGLVRHYYLRRGANLADIQVNLVAKGERSDQSHEIAKRIRPKLKNIAARYGARIKVAGDSSRPTGVVNLVAESTA